MENGTYDSCYPHVDKQQNNCEFQIPTDFYPFFKMCMGLLKPIIYENLYRMNIEQCASGLDWCMHLWLMLASLSNKYNRMDFI